MRPTTLIHLLDKVPQHLFGDLEVGDHTVLEWPDRHDRSGRATKHALRFNADSKHGSCRLIESNDGWLRQDDAAPTDVDKRVRRTEIDSHVAAAEAKHPRSDTDGSPLAAATATSDQRFYVVLLIPPACTKLMPSRASSVLRSATGNPTTFR